MKKLCLFFCLVGAIASAASAAELLWANFDASPTGSVAALPGWTRAAWLGGITARVDNVNYSHSPSNILELPWNATASSAVFTNFNSTYSTNEHPVIRCSAKLVTLNTNAYFQLGLRNSASGARLTFEGTNGYGTFGTETHDSVHFPLVNDRFVDVTFFYNRSNNHYRIDYDYTNRLAWSTNNAPSSVVHTQFNQFVVSRPGGTASTTGSFLVDDVSVETFPPHVWAWWRCTSISTRPFVEQLGTFPPARRASVANAAGPGATDPVWDGRGDAHNEGASRQLVATATNCAVAIPASTNWTVEAVFRMSAATQNVCILDWGRGNGSTATGAWINVAYNTNGYINLNLRDTQQADVSFTSLALRNFVPNGRWQHVAVVKSNANVALHVDYQLVTNRTLVAVSDGSYGFGTDSRATVGISLGGANPCDASTLIDEVRISGKALVPAEFLQPGQPMIVDIDNSPTNAAWQLTMKGILGKSYRLDASPSIGPGATWQYATGLVASYTFNYVDVPSTVPRTNFVRLVREN